MPIQIKWRRGTKAQWIANNPILLIGEMVIETDTYQIKIGDGVTAYTSLPYAFSPGDPAPEFYFF